MASVPNSGSAAPPPPPVWDAQPIGASAVAYGGFWIRVLAYVIDGILLGIAGGIIGRLFGPVVPEMTFDQVFFSPRTGLSLIVGWLYFALLESSERGATVGKMALGLRVVTSRGERLTFLNATGRYFAKFLSALILGIGFLMVAFTDRKRGLHDMIADTLVIKTR
jgi:uncharacterized RDD family membrane protein YckC